MMIAKTLKKLRQNIGYTQQQVADALNIERSTYTYYETGKTMPDVNNIIKLAKIFNVPYSEILENGENSKIWLNDYARENNFLYKHSKSTNDTYDLSKKEKTLIACFRVLPEKDREEFISNILNRTSELKK